MEKNDDEKKENNHNVDDDTEFGTFSPMNMHNALQFSWSRLFIDIRTEKEYLKSHIYQFINIPITINDEKEIKLKLNNILKSSFSPNTKKNIDLYFYSNKQLKQSKKDIAFYKQIIKVLTNDMDSYNFNQPKILSIDYETFEDGPYKYLCQTNQKYMAKYPSIIYENKLFLGNLMHAKSKKIIKKLNITHILNMTDELNNEFENDKELSQKLTYLQCKITDSPDANI